MTFSLKEGSPREASLLPTVNIAYITICTIVVTFQSLKGHAWFSLYPIGVQICTVLAFQALTTMENRTDKDHRPTEHIGNPNRVTGNMREVQWDPSPANSITQHWASAHNRLLCCSQDTHLSQWLENNIT